MAEKVTPRSQDFSGWYNDVVLKAELADYSPVHGCMVLRPYGYALWENIQAALDKRFKATGHVNAYFPLLIPMSFFKREAEHIEGFAPELAVVTHGGGEELDEPLVIRPTSETIIMEMYSKWIRSYRDLPLLINQWCNVLRWEMRTRLFLRTAEFLWQEGHTAHASAQEAEEETLRMLDVYADFCIKEAAMPVIKGKKSESEKFAGAQYTTGIEAMMGDKKALQAGTSHYFGQNFSSVFGVKFLNRSNELEAIYETSWGLSWRTIGGIIMMHGDDQGLIMPPRLAPHQVVIVPIWRKDAEKTAVLEAANQIRAELSDAGVRVKQDDREEISPGFKFNDWEMRGVPLRLELGPRDVAQNVAVIARRDMPGKEAKLTINRSELAGCIQQLLVEIQNSLLDRATKFRQANTHQVSSYEELKAVVENGWAEAWWCGDAACEARIKEDTKATNRTIPFDQPGGRGKCAVCGRDAHQIAIFAKAY